MEFQKFFDSQEDKSFDAISTELRKMNLVVKEDGDKYLVHSNHSKSDFSNALVREANGIIFEKKTNKLLCKPFNHIKEYPDQYEYDGDFTVEECIDGTLIKLYFYNNTWQIATNKCIDANKATWLSSKTFMILFCEVQKKCLDYKMLDTNCCYLFTLIHPENRNIVRYNEKMLYHIYTYDLKNNEEIDVDIGVQKPCKFNYDIKRIVHECQYLPLRTEGFIVKDKHGNRTKIQSSLFLKAKQLKGNNPDMIYRCVVLYSKNLQQEFLEFFPEYTEYVSMIENMMLKMSYMLHQEYLNVFVKKRFIPVKKSHMLILKHLHNEYKVNKTPTTHHTVLVKLKGYSPLRVYKLLYNVD